MIQKGVVADVFTRLSDGKAGMHVERVTEPEEIAPALRRALDGNAQNRPAFIKVIWPQYPVWEVRAGMEAKDASRTQGRTNF